VAFFTDSFHEVNGVALTSRQFEDFARRRELPFLSVHAGPRTHTETIGSVTRCEIQRSKAAFNVEATSDLAFDPLIARNRTTLLYQLGKFRPDVVHVTGPGDFGMLGAWLAAKAQVPLAASWHTNVHEYAGRRLEKLLGFLPGKQLSAVSAMAERHALAGAARFYKIARLLFAPNKELIELLQAATGKPCFLMQRGVDSAHFHPAKRSAGTRPFTIGYVGRLSVEKNVRFLAEIERTLAAAGRSEYRFLIVGSGGEQEWLHANLRNAEFPGVLKGEDLARAYADMDVFAFPSCTDTFGNVVLEALSSGVAVIVTNRGGPKFLVQSGVTGYVAQDDAEFVRRILELLDARERLRQMKSAAREYACSMAWDRVFERVYEAYNSTLFSDPSFRAAS
jgi:glycosyltransferase involved in cell wall biosynthesis